MILPPEVDTAAARAVLGIASAQELIVAANMILAAGYVSPALSSMVNEPAGSLNFAELFQSGLREIGYSSPSEVEAVLQLSAKVAQQIVNRTVPYLEGAEAIRRLQLRTDEDIVSLEPFRHAVFEANPEETNADLRKYYEDMVMDAARKLSGAA